MSFSVGFIGKINDEIVFTEIKQFLEMLEGFELIYIKRSKENLLYVIDKNRLERLGSNFYQREADQ